MRPPPMATRPAKVPRAGVFFAVLVPHPASRRAAMAMSRTTLSKRVPRDLTTPAPLFEPPQKCRVHELYLGNGG
jgi:hypothetical protein